MSMEVIDRLIAESPRKDAANPVWLRRERHAIMKAGAGVQQYFIDRAGATVKNANSINSTVGWVIGCTDDEPTGAPEIELRDLPDVDIDFPDNKRHMVFEYLQGKYGLPHVSKLGNVNTLQALSVLAQVGKRFGLSVDETSGPRNALLEYSSGDARYGHALRDTMDTTSPGQRFKEDHPEASLCVADLELHPSHYGVHAAAIIVCNDPIIDFCTVNSEGVAQVDKADSEYIGLLKIDALGLRTLGIIEDTGVVNNDMMYDLPLDDEKAIALVNAGKLSDIFQFSGRALQMVASNINVTKFSQIDHITAIARPGPLSSGMSDLYAERSAGRAKIEYVHPSLEPILGDTQGVILYQEQLMRIVREIGGFGWDKTAMIRKAVSARKGTEFFHRLCEDFVKGALITGLDEATARAMWESMCAYGSWAFNASHSHSYARISYWCLWIKAHYPMEWAAANLRSAKDDDHTIEILREMVREGVEYTAFDPIYSGLDWQVVTGEDGKKRLLGGVKNVKGYGPVKSLRYIQRREAGELTEKDIEAISKADVQFEDLQEAHTLWGHLYERPRLIRCLDPIKNMSDVRDGREGVIIVKLKKKLLDSEHDPKRVKKRGGKPWGDGPHEFLDMQCVDDSVSATRNLRIRPKEFDDFGRDIYENSPNGSWWLIRGWKVPGLGMFIVKKAKRLTIEEHGRAALVK